MNQSNSLESIKALSAARFEKPFKYDEETFTYLVRNRLPCPLPRSLGPCFCVSIKKQWWDLQDFESPPTIVPLIQGFAHELPSHPVYHLGLNEKVRYDELRWASWLQSNLSWKNSLKPLFEPERSPKWSIKMLPENTIRQKDAKGSSQNLLPVQTSQAHFATIQSPLAEIVFIHLYPSVIFEGFLMMFQNLLKHQGTPPKDYVEYLQRTNHHSSRSRKRSVTWTAPSW